MGCGCGGSSNTSNVALQNKQVLRNRIVTTQEPCTITKEILTKWVNILNCVKSSGKSKEVNLSDFAVNQYLGLIQSALNYPDNYCHYGNQLDYFKDNILLKIVENAPECIQQ